MWFLFFLLRLIVKVKTINKENRFGFVFNSVSHQPNKRIDDDDDDPTNRLDIDREKEKRHTFSLYVLYIHTHRENLVPLVNGLHNSIQTVQFIVFTWIFGANERDSLLFWARCRGEAERERQKSRENEQTNASCIYLIRTKTKRSFIKILRCIIRLYSYSYDSNSRAKRRQKNGAERGREKCKTHEMCSK